MYSTHAITNAYEEKQYPLSSIKSYVFDYKKEVVILFIRDAKLKTK